MDSEQKTDSDSSDFKGEMSLKSDLKTNDDGSSLESAPPKSHVNQKENMNDSKGHCSTDCSTWHPPKALQKPGIGRIGMYGLGAWRMGNVPSDVIFDKI